MYCDKCGKKLEDGEICSCKTNEAAPAEAAVVTTPAPAQSSLPDTKKLADGMKAIGSNPIVTDLVNVLKGTFTAPVKQVGTSAKRTDILWIILAAVEMLIASFSITVTSRHLLHVLATGGSFGKVSFKDFAEVLSLMEAGVFKTFALTLLTVVIVYAVATALMFGISMFYKRNASFANVCNMLATANLPGTALMFLALIFGWIYAPISLFLMVIAAVSMIILSYLGLQKLGEGKFTSSPYWAYLIYNAAVILVAFLVGKGFLSVLFETILSKIGL